MRRKVIELHRRGMGSRLIHRETGLDLSTIKQWVRTYGYQGEGFFMERPRVREYGYAFREMVVRDVLENHLSLREVSARYGIGHGLAVKWVSRVREAGYEAVMGRRPGTRADGAASELDRLRTENERLRAEVALLKKLKALAEERRARQAGIWRGPSKG